MGGKKNKKEQEELPALDKDQESYREYFGGITDRYLIGHSYDPEVPRKNGYIIFIDREYDLDFIDYREESESPDSKEMNRAIANLQMAEAVPTRHLPTDIRLEFKRILGTGFLHAFNGNFDDIPDIISKAEE